MKPLKLTGDIKYLGIIVPCMMECINKKDGINISYAKNHHTVMFTLNTGEEIIARAYETKTMIIIDWSIENDNT